MNVNIIKVLENTIELYSKNVFIKDEVYGSITYKEFYDRVLLKAEQYLKKGLSQGGKVFVSETNPVLILESVFAAWTLQGYSFVINPLTPEVDQKELIERVKPVIVQKNGNVFCRSGPTFECDEENVNEIAMVVFTSGTTKNSKGILLSHRNIISNAMAIAEYIDLQQVDHTLITKSLHHISPFTGQVLLSMYAGSSISFASGVFNPKKIVKCLAENNVTYIDMVGTMLRFIINNMSKDLKVIKSLKFISVNGEHLSNEDLLRIVRTFQFSKIFYSYGLSEAGPRVTCLQHEDLINKLGSVGKAIKDVEVKIHYQNEQEQESNAKRIGEVWIKGPGVMKGYWSNPELTAQKLKGEWLCSGDIGYLDKDDYLYIVGRMDNMIIRNGQNIYPEEIEDIIKSITGVKDCLVTGLNDSLHGEIILAIVQLDSTEQIRDTHDLFKYLIQIQTPSYFIPQKIFICDEIPRSQNGKVLRNKKILEGLFSCLKN
ncbi:hypothetical protein A616_28825 [Brevibacillus brevis X23]|nr:hypothetical protein A616_28825 [Brevibacillus brevis X23]